MSIHSLFTSFVAFRAVSILCLFCLTYGCGDGRDPSWLPTFAVTGIVTMDGQPVSDAFVTFSPEGTKPVATSRTDTEGRYKLTTYREGDGAPEGEYVVLVSKTDESMMPKYPELDSDEAAKFDWAQAERDELAATSVLPGKYQSRNNSGLTAKVTSDGKNEFNFDLSSNR